MKTTYLYSSFLFILFTFCVTSLGAQSAHLEIEHNSGSNPHIKLIETQDNDWARIFYENANTTDRWSLAGKLGTTDDKVFGLYYNGGARFLYNETTGGFGIGTITPEDLLHVSGGDVQISDISPRLDIIADGTNPSTLGFGDNGGGADASLSYDPSDRTLTLTTTSSLGILSMNRKTGFNISSNLSSQVTIRANSGTTSTPAQLELNENNNSDFARLRFTQFYSSGTPGYWDIAGKSEPLGSTVGDPEMNFFYHTGAAGTNIMTLDGDDVRVGINETDPTATLSIKQTSGDAGLSIENDTDTDIWAFEIGANDLNLSFNGTTVGFWDDSDGTYTATSDLRVKNNIKEIENGVLPLFMQLKPKTYFYNHTPDQKVASYGYIAQELLDIFPDVVAKAETEEGYYMVNYTKIGVLTTKAVQELNQEVEQLKTKNEKLENELAEMKGILQSILDEK
jgi:hypothetical protein